MKTIAQYALAASIGAAFLLSGSTAFAYGYGGGYGYANPGYGYGYGYGYSVYRPSVSRYSGYNYGYRR